MNWYILALISLFCYGIQKFLFKVAVEKKCSSVAVNFYFMLTVTCVSGLYFLFFEHLSINPLTVLMFSAINAVLFLFLTLSRYESLKFIPSVVAYPLFDLDNIFVVLAAVLLFRELPSASQSIAIVLGIISGFLLSQKTTSEKQKYSFFTKGLLYAGLAVVMSTTLNIVSKVVVVSNLNLILFVFFSYSINTLLLLGTSIFKEHMNASKFLSSDRNSIYFGAIIGVVNFFAFYSTLQALRTGPLSLITVITSFATLLVVVLSVFVYKEKISVRRGVALVLGILSVILLK